MDVQTRMETLETLVQQIGEALVATTETVERLADRIDTLIDQVEQQGYQNFALGDAVQTLTEAHGDSMKRLDRVAEALERLVRAIEQPESE